MCHQIMEHAIINEKTRRKERKRKIKKERWIQIMRDRERKRERWVKQEDIITICFDKARASCSLLFFIVIFMKKVIKIIL